jgi:cardiolipin synthase
MSYNFSTLSRYNRADFLIESDSYYNLFIELIRNAKKSVHLQTYIFDMDDFGTKVHAALKQASLRGVLVYVMLDSVGSKNFSFKNETDLNIKNIYFCRYNRFGYSWLFQWGRRLHHKVLLVDNDKSIVGGINVTKSGYGVVVNQQQMDFAVYLEGPIIIELTRYCELIFKRECQKQEKKSNLMSSNHDEIINRAYENKINATDKVVASDRSVDLQVIINDWVVKRWQISSQYSKLARNAKKSITIINSYFFPKQKFIKELIEAANHGVRVRLILPKKSDWPTYILASQYLYSYFLRNGIEIYEWEKSILHGKLSTVDGLITTVGSFNLNYTSYKQNVEMNITIFSKQFTENLDLVIQEIIDVGCKKIDKLEYASQTSFRLKTVQFFCYLILSIIASLSVILTFQDNNKHKH